MTAIAAYYQASGIWHLVGDAIAPSGDAAALAPRAEAPRALPDRAEHTVSAAAILARNPFDSVTGPLVAPPTPTAILRAARTAIRTWIPSGRSGDCWWSLRP